MRFRNLSLGFKLNIALLVFLLVLGVATSAIVVYGFSRTKDNANDRSREALEEEGKLALQALVSGATESGGLQFESAAEIGQRAARYMEIIGDQPPQPFESEFARTEGGLYYRSDPAGVADFVVLAFMPLDDPAVQSELAYAVALDAISPVLFEGFEDEVGGRNFDPNVIAFIGVNGVGHIYPARGIHEFIPADLDTSDLMSRVGPENNPERRTLWTAPYEDTGGQGLVVTAETPVYEGDTFRGAIQVDLLISRLIDQINGIRPTPGGFAFYVDTRGDLLESDHYDLLSREAQENPQLASILDGMKRGESSDVIVDTVPLEGRQFFVAHAPMLSLGGSFAVAAPVDEVTEQAAIITSGIDDDANRTLWIMLGVMAGLFVAGVVGAGLLNRRVLVLPIQRLAAATETVAGGDLETNVPVDREDELGALAGSFNVMVEQLRESERELERRVEERTRELDALLRADSELFRSLNLDEVLQALVDVAVDVLGVDKSMVTLFDRERGEVRVRAARNLSDETIHRFQEILAQPGSRNLPDDLEIAIYGEQPGDTIPELQAISDREGVRITAEVPIKSAAIGALGGFALGYMNEHRVTEDEKRLFTALADRAAVAISNAELYARAEDAASLEERQRLARELHDSVSQALYGIALGARTAREQLDREPAKAIEPVEYVMSLAEAGLAEMRALIFELRPESLATEGLVAALDKQVAATKARFGIEVESDLCDEPDVPIETKEAFYRIGQEALHNIVKHAKAQHASVSLRHEDGALTLEVRDDGVGFDPNGEFPGHLGLQSMRERAAKAGATFEIESAAGSGSRVRLRNGG